MVKQMVGFHEDKTWAQFSCSVFLWREKKKRERENNKDVQYHLQAPVPQFEKC